MRALAAQFASIPFEFLLKGDVFNADFINNWIEMKQKEYDALRLRPHPFEFQMYYDV